MSLNRSPINLDYKMWLHAHTTGIHYNGEFIEWAVLRKTKGDAELLQKGEVPLAADSPASPSQFPANALHEIHKNFHGVITVALPSSNLLMRMLELPSADSDELRGMVELQIDQIAPFPADQLSFSFEVLHQTENHSRVLAVAASRTSVDELGDQFKAQNVFIRSVDAQILVWWSLLSRHADLPSQGRVIFLLEEHAEFSMMVVDEGVPVCIRSLELFHDFTQESVLHEIAGEMRYTLLSLETEYGHRDHQSIEWWSTAQLPPPLAQLLSKEFDTPVNPHDLSALPSLAEGLAVRSAERKAHHIELVPHEWVELQRRRRFMKVTTITSIAVLSLWLAVISLIGAIFGIQTASYHRLQHEAEKYHAPAEAARAAQDELLSLQKYADHSRSALECLLEITEALPNQVEISSFTYTKDKAVRLSGSGTGSKDINEFFTQLMAGEIFDEVENPSVKPPRFSITATLPHPEPEKRP